MNYGIGDRRGLDLALLWLWYRLAAAALIQSLAWKLPYVVGVALKRPKGGKKKKRPKKAFLKGLWKTIDVHNISKHHLEMETLYSHSI